MSPQCRTWGLSIAVAAIAVFPAFTQTSTGTAGSSTGSGSTTGSTTGTTPGKGTAPSVTNTDPNSQNNANQQRMQRPVLITGRVVLDDGSPLPTLVIVERVCTGSTHAEGYTDSKGYFSLQLGQSNEVVGDASEGSSSMNRNYPSGLGMNNTTTSSSSAGNAIGLMDNRFSGCEIRARLGGYRSQSISLFGHGPLDNPDIGTILLHKLGQAEEATTVTATTLKASKPARKALQKGQAFAKKSQFDSAIASYQEAVKEDPNFAFAWCELGRLQADKGQLEEARQSFQAAAKAEPRWPDPVVGLAIVAAHAHNWKELAELTDRVVRLDSFDYPQAYLFNAVANYNLKHMDIAEKSARSAQKLDTQHQFPEIEHLIGTILADHRQYTAAADALRNYLVLSPRATDAAAVRKQLEEVERLAAATDVARKDPQ